jgi:iron complex outermembrane receptor protein
MWNWIALLVCIWLLVGMVGHGLASTNTDEVLSPEELLFQEIPVVVTSTRTEQSILDVPNAVTVITAEDIQASGATTIEELLQTVPGLELMRMSVSDLNVSARGFNNPASSSVLAMIDGRSIYADFFGVVQWDALDVTLQEIERIEVIRGPGSVLYGANALLGTINIITKHPRELSALYMRTGLGSETSLVTMTAAQATDQAAAKASIQYETRDHFRNTTIDSSMNTIVPLGHDRDETGLRARLFNATLDYRLDDETELSLSGGQVRVRGDLYTGVGTHEFEGPRYYGKIDFRHGPWTFQGFLNLLDYDVGVAPTVFPVGPPASFRSSRIKSSTLDLELQRAHSSSRHDMLWGVNFRRVVTNSPAIFGSRESEALYAVFLQDELRVTDSITAFLGIRADKHPKSGLNVSPRVGLVARMGEKTRLRLAWSRSFRNPTTVENYASYPLPNSALPLTVLVQGNDDVDPSWTTAFEIGLRMKPHRRLVTQLDLFYNVLEDFRTFTMVSAGPPTTVLSYRNQGSTNAWGGELGFELDVCPSLHGFASYSFQSANGPFEGATPRHKASVGVRGSAGTRVRYALTGVYVGHTHYEADPFSAAALPDNDIDSRFTVDGFLGLQVREGIEVGVRGRNIFHQVRRHHPHGDEIGSELLFTLTAEF